MGKYNDIFFKRTNFYIDKEIKLDARSLQVLVCIDERKSVGQIAKELKLPVETLRDILKRLFRIKLIQRLDVNVEYMDRRFAETVETLLIDLTGPLGSMLLDEAIESFKLDADSIPKDKAKDLIYAIAKDIPDDEESEKFVTAMIDEIAKYT